MWGSHRDHPPHDKVALLLQLPLRRKLQRLLHLLIDLLLGWTAAIRSCAVGAGLPVIAEGGKGRHAVSVCSGCDLLQLCNVQRIAEKAPC